MTCRYIRSRLAFSMLTGQLLAGVACGGSGNSPTSPDVTQPGNTAPACRTYATSDRRTLTSTTPGVNGAINGTITDACSPYNKSSNELTCTLNYSDDHNLAYSSNIVAKFASVVDFVGDAPRVYIYSTATVHPASVVTTTAGTTSNGSYTYDSQGRLTRFSTQVNTGGAEVLTFSAWDTFARPTAATGLTTTFVYAYDDSARTATITNGRGATITQGFDSNGIVVRQVTVLPGGGTETQLWTIQSTDTVCRTGNS